MAVKSTTIIPAGSLFVCMMNDVGRTQDQKETAAYQFRAHFETLYERSEKYFFYRVYSPGFY